MSDYVVHFTRNTDNLARVQVPARNPPDAAHRGEVEVRLRDEPRAGRQPGGLRVSSEIPLDMLDRLVGRRGSRYGIGFHQNLIIAHGGGRAGTSTRARPSTTRPGKLVRLAMLGGIKIDDPIWKITPYVDYTADNYHFEWEREVASRRWPDVRCRQRRLPLRPGGATRRGAVGSCPTAEEPRGRCTLAQCSIPCGTTTASSSDPRDSALGNTKIWSVSAQNVRHDGGSGVSVDPGTRRGRKLAEGGGCTVPGSGRQSPAERSVNETTRVPSRRPSSPTFAGQDEGRWGVKDGKRRRSIPSRTTSTGS